MRAVGPCRLLLLGAPLVVRGGHTASIRLRKALGLAAYLAVERRAFSREYLAALLWPDQDQPGSLANLRRMLTHLRETVGEGCVATDGDLVRLDLGRVEVDVEVFQSLLRGQAANPHLDRLAAATDLYRGSFLEGLNLDGCPAFDDWQDAVRMRLEGMFDTALEILCRSYLEAGRAREALPVAQRWLELDPLSETAHRALMAIYARAGRPDLARRQYETCARILSRDGLEPDAETRELHAEISARRPGSDGRAKGSPEAPGGLVTVAPSLAPAAAGTPPPRRRRSWRAAALVAGAILAVGGSVSTYLSRRLILGCDTSVQSVEAVLDGTALARLRVALRNDGVGLRSVRYHGAFSSDPTAVVPRDYVVYAAELRMRRGEEISVELDQEGDIERYIESHGVRIPPGRYLATAILDPEGRVYEDSELNNRRAADVLFDYAGTAFEAAFALDIRYGGRGTLDAANPIKVFIGDRSESLLRGSRRARLVVTEEGRHYLPVEDILGADRDGSGYVLVLIHDAWNDLEEPAHPGSGDVPAILRDASGRLAYGMFDVSCGAVVRPGLVYPVHFSPPEPPREDAYEDDDGREVGTVVDRAALPVRQRHTFHDEGTGDVDWDWFQISLGAGETLVVETYSAGGGWECDTSIDLNHLDRYLRTANDKSDFDLYSRLSYENDSAGEQLLFVLVKPHVRYSPGINRFADYVVEFRR